MRFKDNPKLKKFTILCVDDNLESCERLVHTLRRIYGYLFAFFSFSDLDELLEWEETQNGEEFELAMVIITCTKCPMSKLDFIAKILEKPNFRASKKIIVTDKTSKDLKRLLDQGLVDKSLSERWQLNDLKSIVTKLVAEYFVQNNSDFVEGITALANEAKITRRLLAGSKYRDNLVSSPSVSLKTFVKSGDLEENDAEARRMADEIYKTLGPPKKETHSEGDILFQEGNQLDGIWIILSGRMSLFRKIDSADVIFHSKSVGQILGLLALSQKSRKSSFTCKAVTDTTLIYLSLDELNKILECNSVFAGYFLTVLLRSLTLRNRRAVELQIEINTLNRALENERDQLKRTLKQLEQAQMRLIQSEKMATLGQLTAGMAHELNNPITAIRRAADFIYEDIKILVHQFEARKTLFSFLHTELEHEGLPLKNQREIRKSLAQTVEDNDLAKRLVKVGIYDYQRFKEIFSDLPKVEWEDELRRIECYTHLGKSLRNIRSCAERIMELVNSLRSYTRADREMSSAIDVHRGIEDTLLMFRHAGQNIRVERNYAKLPRIQCFVGELNQVWTNIIANALQAMDYRGMLQIKTESLDGKYVRVSIIDDGPGIPPELLPRIFDLNFTTKHGRAEFGLGLGLTICHQIVSRHNGKISVESRPGRTCFTITLPISQSNFGQNPRDEMLSLSSSSIQEQT